MAAVKPLFLPNPKLQFFLLTQASIPIVVPYTYILGISLDTIQVEALKTKLRRTLADHIDYQDTDITHIEVTKTVKKVVK